MKTTLLVVVTALGLSAASGRALPGERPLALGLRWLAEHQLPDGSWRFDPTDAPEKLRFPNPGTWQSETGATGIALLALLSAGQTHTTGKYKQMVKAGLGFLLEQARRQRGEVRKEGVLDLRGRGGEMVWHAVATMALCEDYAMTADRGLRKPAQAALDFLVAGQDPKTGAWASTPGRPPDLATTAWAVLAMKSAHSAYLRVPNEAVKKAFAGLDRFQSGGGALYGRTGPGNDPAASAMGLLCRRYMGWDGNNAALRRGVPQLASHLPIQDDAVGNYFARLLLRDNRLHDAKAWQRMTDRIIQTQVRNGPQRGSWWNPDDASASGGGRLYQTAMNAMTAGIIFRLGIYRPDDLDENFPD